MQNKRTYKKTKTVSGANLFRKWDEWDVGDVMIAKYIGTHTDQYEKECPIIEVVDAQFKDKSGNKYDGKKMVLNNCGMLMKAMKQVQFGEMVQITYTGTSEIEKGKFKGKDAHTMTVDVVEADDGDEEYTDDGDDVL